MFKKFISSTLVSILVISSLLIIVPSTLANEITDPPELIARMYNNTISGECFGAYRDNTVNLQVSRNVPITGATTIINKDITIDSSGNFTVSDLEGQILQPNDEIVVIEYEEDDILARMKVADLTNYSVDYDNEKVNGLPNDYLYNNGLIQVKIRNSAQNESDTVLGSGSVVSNDSTFSIPVLNGVSPYNLGIANESAWIYIFDSRSDGNDASDEENDRTIYVKASNDVRPVVPAQTQTPAAAPAPVTQKSLLSTKIWIKANKTKVTQFDRINLKGRLMDINGKPLGNKKVKIKIDIRGLAIVKTDANGYFKLKTKATLPTKNNKKSFYRAVFTGDVDYLGSSANSKKIFVKKKPKKKS